MNMNFWREGDYDIKIENQGNEIKFLQRKNKENFKN